MWLPAGVSYFVDSLRCATNQRGDDAQRHDGFAAAAFHHSPANGQSSGAPDEQHRAKSATGFVAGIRCGASLRRFGTVMESLLAIHAARAAASQHRDYPVVNLDDVSHQEPGTVRDGAERPRPHP